MLLAFLDSAEEKFFPSTLINNDKPVVCGFDIISLANLESGEGEGI